MSFQIAFRCTFNLANMVRDAIDDLFAANAMIDGKNSTLMWYKIPKLYLTGLSLANLRSCYRNSACYSFPLSTALAEALAIQLNNNAKNIIINNNFRQHHRGKGHVASKLTMAKFEAKEDEKTGDNEELNSIKFVVDIEAGVTTKNKSYTRIVDIEAVATGLNLTPNANNMCTTYSSKDSQLHSPFSSTKHNEKEEL
ncbi:protein WVD2-like 1-like [Trifolium pratense]|uniref:Protein WVD2-like 1-like n=1 Tax=Trifolium pratense TaxID=57577 RepID=A0A2K3PPP2_TRIPR|nr:protein WVD2-like 1-like [Trifolium pratense]